MTPVTQAGQKDLKDPFPNACHIIIITYSFIHLAVVEIDTFRQVAPAQGDKLQC